MDKINTLIDKLKKITQVEIIIQKQDKNIASYDYFWNRIFIDPEIEEGSLVFNYLLLHELMHAYGRIFEPKTHSLKTEEKVNSFSTITLLRYWGYGEKDQIFRYAADQYLTTIEGQKQIVTKTIQKHSDNRTTALLDLFYTPDDQLDKYHKISKQNGYCMYDGIFCNPELYEKAISLVLKAFT